MATKPMRVMQSPLTDEFFAFTAYRIVKDGDHEYIQVTGQKHNVTIDVQAFIDEAVKKALSKTKKKKAKKEEPKPDVRCPECGVDIHRPNCLYGYNPQFCPRIELLDKERRAS